MQQHGWNWKEVVLTHIRLLYLLCRNSGLLMPSMNFKESFKKSLVCLCMYKRGGERYNFLNLNTNFKFKININNLYKEHWPLPF